MDADSYICELNAEDQKYCEEVLRENEEKKKEGIDTIREWLNNNSHLNAKTDTFNILRFLRSCKYDIEKAKNKIMQFYMFKTTAPEWFVDRNPLLSELQELLKIGIFLPLRKRDEEGRLVVIIRSGVHNPSIHDQNNVIKIGLMILDLALRSEDTTVYGVFTVFDMSGVGYAHAKALKVEIIRKLVSSWQIYPVRVRSLDFVCSPTYINVVLDVFRLFMSRKLKKRLHVHRFEKKSLSTIVPKEILPEEYGGTDGTLQDLIDHWHTTVTNSRQWYVEDEPHKCNEEYMKLSPS